MLEKAKVRKLGTNARKVIWKMLNQFYIVRLNFVRVLQAIAALADELESRQTPLTVEESGQASCCFESSRMATSNDRSLVG
jgi:hypothetical protein